MNLVALVGNLATEPELRHTEDGSKTLCTFRLAVSRIGSTDADFFNVVTWGRQAEICSQHLSIGRRVAVDGRLRYSAWDAPDGTRRSRIEVVAQRIDMLDGGRRRTATAEPSGEIEAASEAASDSASVAVPAVSEFALA